MAFDLKTHRKERIEIFYLFFLFDESNDYIESVINNYWEKFDLTDKDLKIIHKYLDEHSVLTETIKEYIPKDWEWQRINYLTRAILFNAYGESVLFNNKRVPIINESVEYAKLHDVPEASKLINAILDNLLEIKK